MNGPPVPAPHIADQLDPRLRTPRLELRPLERGDVDGLWPYVSDPELPRYMGWEAHRDRSETLQFASEADAARRDGSGFVWTVLRGSEVCGLIALESVVRVLRAWRQDQAQLGYWLGSSHRNQGLGTEAAREVLRFGFGQLALHKVMAGCVAENRPSQRVVEKLGFRLIGEQRDHFFRFGRWWDHRLYELLVTDWRP